MPSFEEMMQVELENMKESLRHSQIMMERAGKDSNFGSYMEGHVDELKARIGILETYLKVYGRRERG